MIIAVAVLEPVSALQPESVGERGQHRFGDDVGVGGEIAYELHVPFDDTREIRIILAEFVARYLQPTCEYSFIGNVRESRLTLRIS